MDFLIKNTKGLTLKTKGKYCTEDLVIEIDPSLVEGYMEIDELPEVGLPRVLYKLMLEEPEYYIWENDEWVLLNTKGGGGLIEVTELPEVGEEDVVYKLVSGPTQVPNSGYVDMVYYNYNLTIEETNNILSQLTYIQTPLHKKPISGLLLTESEDGIIAVDWGDGYEFLRLGNLTGTAWVQLFNSSKTANTQLEGWASFNETEEAYKILGKFDSIALSNYSGIPIGTENGKLADLISTTPSFEAKEEYYLYESGAWVKISGANIVSKVGTVVPNSGYIEKVYFNTEINENDIQNLIDTLPLYQTPFFDYPVYPLLFSSDFEFGIMLSVTDEEALGKAYMIAYANATTNKTTILYYKLTNSSLNYTPLTTKELVINKEVIAEYSGLPIGTENGKLADLISTTPFENKVIKELSGDYEAVELEVTENTTVDVGAMLDEGKMPMNVKVNVASGGGESTLKKLLDATKNAYYLFSNYQGKSVDDLIKYDDTENVTNMQNMFMNCKALTTIPQLDTSNVTDMGSMFYSCFALTTIPQLDTSEVISMKQMFYNCWVLTEIPPLDTSRVSNMQGMFYSCQALETIQQLDMIKVSNASSMFNNCKALTNLTLLNIKVNLDLSQSEKLTLESLINTVKELINVGSARTLTMGTANLSKIASTYVKFTDSSVTSIPKNEKGDVVVCESTDTGAMLLKDYALLKNWTLA